MKLHVCYHCKLANTPVFEQMKLQKKKKYFIKIYWKQFKLNKGSSQSSLKFNKIEDQNNRDNSSFDNSSGNDIENYIFIKRKLSEDSSTEESSDEEETL